LKSFLCCFGTFFQDLHHSAKELMLQLSIRWARFRGCRTENQNCRVNTQEECAELSHQLGRREDIVPGKGAMLDFICTD
jgi:hypothetical protein